MLIGIDFSLNSPSITIKYNQDNNTKYHFCSFFNCGNKNWKEKELKSFKNHKLLFENTDVSMIDYNRDIVSDDYTKKESEKIADANKLANLITEYINNFIINDNIKVNNIIVAIEGFSYGSKGAAYNDLIMYNSFLRKSLADKITNPTNIKVFSPKHAKKLAGNGNADKDYMINAFIENKLNDSNLENTLFYKFVKNMDKSTLKPVDDLVDSYFILNCIL